VQCFSEEVVILWKFCSQSVLWTIRSLFQKKTNQSVTTSVYYTFHYKNKFIFSEVSITAFCWTPCVRNSVVVFLPSKSGSHDNICYPCGKWNCLSVCFKFILMHFWTVRCRRILYSVFQGEQCVLWSAKWCSHVPVNSYLCPQEVANLHFIHLDCK
jgi:hypothetical protein